MHPTPSEILPGQHQDAICALCQFTLPDLLLRRRYMDDHQPSLRALLEASDRGCKSCAILYHNFAYAGYKDTALDDGRVVIGRSSKQEYLKVMLSGADNETTYGAEIPFHIERIGQQLSDERPEEIKTCLAKAADDAENVGLTVALIEDCLKNHPICASAGVGYDMPTRLLDVSPSGNKDMVRIVPGTNAQVHSGRYVCLSHCWGIVPPDAPWKLTESRKESYMTEISVDVLPLTFRQSIIYTRDLGERYLWIDSLCIIQDSAEDWATEASKMGTIYTNSLVTLSAASASSSNGCILERDSKIVDPVILSLDPGAQNGRKAYVFHSVPEELQLQLSVPVAKRAWCLQERKLTVRVVQFTPYQWIWTCKTSTTSERTLRKLAITADTFGTEGQTSLSLHNKEDTSGTWTTRADGVISDESEVKRYKESRKDYNEWYKTVEEFTKCDITCPTDRLPALAGLAQRQQSRVPDTYLAGLWENDIWDGLIWTSLSCPKSRPSVYIAPSWSWACLNSAVTFEGFLHYKDRFSPKLISASIWRSSIDALGMVQAGHLRLKGYLKTVPTKPIIIGYQKPESSTHVSSANTPYERTSRDISNGQGSVWLDTDADADNCDTIICLAVLDSRGIALKPINVEGSCDRPAYMRVGSVKFVPEMFEGAAEVVFDLY